jgi:hypothetical protein
MVTMKMRIYNLTGAGTVKVWSPQAFVGQQQKLFKKRIIPTCLPCKTQNLTKTIAITIKGTISPKTMRCKKNCMLVMRAISKSTLQKPWSKLSRETNTIFLTRYKDKYMTYNCKLVGNNHRLLLSSS